MAPQVHDEYGKSVLREAAGKALADYGPAVEVDYGTRIPARIDGVVADVAIEVESRTSKQVRGAILDLLFHRSQKKLLVLLPVHMSNPQLCARQCEFALRRFIAPNNFRVVVLRGHGHARQLEADATLIRSALSDLGLVVAA